MRQNLFAKLLVKFCDGGYGAMSTFSPLRAVIDTNVIFEGLTKQGGSAGVIIEAWLGDLFQA